MTAVYTPANGLYFLFVQATSGKALYGLTVFEKLWEALWEIGKR